LKELLEAKEAKKSTKDFAGFVLNVSFSELLNASFYCHIVFEASPVNLVVNCIHNQIFDLQILGC
jgi:hypothetical protein